jgi:hypothetical protein
LFQEIVLDYPNRLFGMLHSQAMQRESAIEREKPPDFLPSSCHYLCSACATRK